MCASFFSLRLGFGAGRQARKHVDECAVMQQHVALCGLQPVNRFFEIMRIVEFGFRHRAVGIDLAAHMRRCFRQEMFVRFAQRRIAVDRAQSAWRIIIFPNFCKDLRRASRN